MEAYPTAGGISATSAVVNISVVAPVPISLTRPIVGNGQLSFSYSANAGLSYLVQSSPDLVNWTSLVTNVASASSVGFTQTLATVPARYYQVGRLPNH